MPSADVLDLPRLLAAIPGDNPAGVDLRTDASPNSAYYKIKDARTQARAAERQFIIEGEEASGPPPDWKPLLKNAIEAIATKSKDLEVTAYLVEALVRVHGFAGLRDGFRLAHGLIEQFWGGLYPVPDEEGVATRVAPLTGLNGEDSEGTLVNPIANVLLTEGSSAGPFTCAQYQQAVTLAQVADESARQAKIAQGGVSLQMFERAATETSAEFFVGLSEDIKQCMEWFGKLCAILDEKCAEKAPPSSNIRSALSNCLDVVKSIARDKLGGAAEGDEGAAAGAAAGSAAAGGVSAAVSGALQSREQAFQMLLKVADFFRRTEPHTPVSYAIEQAVRWGRMPLPELMAELIPEDSVREAFFRQVGIKPPPPS